MESLEKCVGDVAARFGLRYVVLFGSRAVGYAAEFSDWDLAVKVGRRMSFTELGRLYGELERCVSGRLDLLVLDWADPFAAWEALGRRGLSTTAGPTASESTTGTPQRPLIKQPTSNPKDCEKCPRRVSPIGRLRRREPSKS